jgi:acetyltransferase
MINEQLINPQSIVVIGGSNDLEKPGGKILYNILNRFRGKVFVTNKKHNQIQGLKAYPTVEELPEDIDLAVLSINASACPETVKTLATKKNTKAFIIVSAGFSEINEAGAKLEKEITDIINETNGCLIGPNCIGIMNKCHQSVFTEPIPYFHPQGADFISGSGATAVFTLETGYTMGLRFNSIFSVGNSPQTGIEDVLEYLNQTYNPESSSKIKLLYIENIRNPDKLLKNALSLTKKGCKIAAIKAGTSPAGCRAAASHTGAIASSDMAINALFKKAGIIRCYSRYELAAVAAVFMSNELKGSNVAIITHAGGPAVMLTDTLEKGGINIPPIEESKAETLKKSLHEGSCVKNPIDLLATGTATQLETAINACEKEFHHIDAIIVIFGSPGLFNVYDVYEVLHLKIKTCKKPIYPVLPSVVNAKSEIAVFTSKGNVNFQDEVILGNALIKIHQQPQTGVDTPEMKNINIAAIRKKIHSYKNGFLKPSQTSKLLQLAGIQTTDEIYLYHEKDIEKVTSKITFPLALKIIGPIHKSDIGGVRLNINSLDDLRSEFLQLTKTTGFEGAIVQPMLSGIELFIGAKYEANFGHIVLCGLGGIFVESLKDVSFGLAPLSTTEAKTMISQLKSYNILKGVRGNTRVNLEAYADAIVRLSTILFFTKEIKEIDINPLIAIDNKIIAIDARIRIETSNPH